MMNRRNSLLALSLVAAVAVGWAVVSFACGDKDTDATAASVTAAKASRSQAHGASVASTAAAKAACCRSQDASAVTASNGACTRSKDASATASNGACSAHAAMANSAAGVCPYAASAGSCPAHKAGAVTAVGNGQNGVLALPIGSSCRRSAGQANATAARTGCEMCDEFNEFDVMLQKASAVTQVVPLKNGVMFVYTADNESRVHAVQAAAHRRQERIVEIAHEGTDVHLCDGCRSMRGAMASGKLHREVVNIEGGSLTLVTSEDPEVIRAIQSASGLQSVKS